MREIVLPITKPETEWVRGRALRKVSPTFDHARVQGALTILLTAWAPGHGTVGPEWRFRVSTPEGPRRPLVPDVAFVATERLRGVTRAELQAPAFAPTAAFEVLSPRDREADVADKIATYLAAGCDLVVVVDTAARATALHTLGGVTRLAGTDLLRHPVLPGFAVALDELFRRALDEPFANG